jgi:transcription antitermination factor NusG
MTGWCILRTSPGQTLRLTDALGDAGFEVWTPTETMRAAGAVGRDGRPRRNGKDEFVIRPMLPSFVFAEADRLNELLYLARSPAQLYRVWDSEQRRMVERGHPRFSVFHVGNKVPLVSDQAMLPLRTIEARRRKPRGAVPTWKTGDRVRLSEGSFAGLSGEVTAIRGRKGKTVWVVFPGWPMSVEFSSWLLRPELDDSSAVNVDHSQSERGNPGRRAA